jgi:hypothetical protein
MVPPHSEFAAKTLLDSGSYGTRRTRGLFCFYNYLNVGSADNFYFTISSLVTIIDFL